MCRSSSRKWSTWRAAWVSAAEGGQGGRLGGWAQRDGMHALCLCADTPPRILPTLTLQSPGWHEFAEFVSEDVGTVDSGLNSMARWLGCCCRVLHSFGCCWEGRVPLRYSHSLHLPLCPSFSTP